MYGIQRLLKVDDLTRALRLAIQGMEKLKFGRKDSRVLRLLRRALAAAEDLVGRGSRNNPQLSIPSLRLAMRQAGWKSCFEKLPQLDVKSACRTSAFGPIIRE